MDKKSDHVKSVEKAADILLAFSEEKSQLSLMELSAKLKLPKSTVYRLLTTLESKGFVDQNGHNGKYQLGLKLLKISSVVLRNYRLKDVALPVMTEMRDKIGETINLYVKRNLDRVCIEQVEGYHVLRRISSIGDVLPLYCGASGKLLLANEKDTEIERVIGSANIKMHTENTIMDREVLLEELEKIKKQSFAFSRGERENGVASVAAPIRNHEGAVIAAVSISGHDSRFFGESVQKYIKLVIAGANAISNNLGYTL
ncbi:MAG: IclR family transcriptional regulator [Peptococcaceae bacterium]